jgi:glycine hydroxymethyltransferase
LTHWMCDILDALEDGNAQQVIAEVKEKVLDICQRYPVYQ